ncbi:ABC transporter substrate-binding protein [Nitratireductor aquimarinus]|uniref:ABC transporter substrate-binding protein n=1 Tax=Alphaproteobacteria TaxID=28211 RepID=UPI0019D39634|nr:MULTISPECIES: ABC transporter substrate-binding protein [Alphaproteobacteria]MBY6024417.1 ABC transporter substrate-binding protein [Nitratireductor sp. DP7N14-4]MBN7759150.1 ABC transporter substrate-binding protein [Nitratireductor aquimarinus]MBN7761397.1 ABC transporter substrate-binding protein [Nitratireductor aquibiodomus]MBN7778579.1 ABC transporter substrate-binding protein [Nitratireductor pacificus]MBN7782902.1 ABC transporter substrate-binding protein [Nitratireductor pacificus]
MKTKTTFAAALLAATVLSGAASAKTLVYCSEGSPEGFDPALYTAGTTFDASSKPVYNRLVQFEPGTTKTVPGLAESWEVSDDGLEVTFKLREGVKFHTTDFFTPSRDFNADDVLFSFNRQYSKDHPYNAYVEGASWEYFNGMSMPDLIKSIDKVDDYTVKFVLNRPEAPFIANLAMDFASIFSKEYADQLAEAGTMSDLNQKPVGTGPFQFVAYQPDAVIRYKAHPDYWNGKQPIDDLVFAITTEASVRQQKLIAGECHITPYPNPADIESLKANDALKVDEQEGLNVGYLAYNTKVAPFDNAKVRKALNSAINKEAILDAVFQGAGQAAKNPIPPTMWSYNNAVEDDAYDPEASKKMLEEAGVTDLSMKIWAMPVQRPYNPNARRMAELIQEDFSKVGVNVEIVSFEWGEYLERSKEEDRDGAVLLGWTGDNGDPDNFLAVLLGCDGVGGSNRAQWCNEEFEGLIQKAKTLSSQDERAKLYEEAQVVFKREAPWATIAHSVVHMPMRKEVTGYKMDPLGGHAFEGVDLAE